MPAYKPIKYPSVLEEIRELERAVALINMGARTQMIQSLVRISRERLLRLYHELRGHSPPKGLLPYSDDWFMLWRPRIHASIWMRGFSHDRKRNEAERIVQAHAKYLAYCASKGAEPIVSITRAWIMVALFRDQTFSTRPCDRCKEPFIVYTMGLNDGFVCGICRPPSKAGKSIRWQRGSDAISTERKLCEKPKLRLASRSDADCTCGRGAGSDALRPVLASSSDGTRHAAND